MANSEKIVRIPKGTYFFENYAGTKKAYKTKQNLLLYIAFPENTLEGRVGTPYGYLNGSDLRAAEIAYEYVGFTEFAEFCEVDMKTSMIACTREGKIDKTELFTYVSGVPILLGERACNRSGVSISVYSKLINPITKPGFITHYEFIIDKASRQVSQISILTQPWECGT